MFILAASYFMMRERKEKLIKSVSIFVGQIETNIRTYIGNNISTTVFIDPTVIEICFSINM